jgi:hypothetical protein
MANTKTESRPDEPVQASRPYIAHAEYGVPKTMKGALPWSHAVERLEKAKNYWIGTAQSDGKPHTMPTWGVWVDNTLYFGGGPETRWSRNLTENPQVAVHLESGDDVVIVEGRVDRITDPADPRLTAVDDAYEVKYKMRHGAPVWVLRPKVVFAWSQFPTNMTRWKFDDSE